MKKLNSKVIYECFAGIPTYSKEYALLRLAKKLDLVSPEVSNRELNRAISESRGNKLSYEQAMQTFEHSKYKRLVELLYETYGDVQGTLARWHREQEECAQRQKIGGKAERKRLDPLNMDNPSWHDSVRRTEG